ncbi:hypothetical protein QBC46DRAFT_381117 [Diplogelasinospora grovesii]|uniref:Uncharacterized protein n=1 Tax=Diplogelasinospora grovesii TaxID=303347 RepID=A0AAN6NA99_9PEZI|nr:hypothetical protein QBC46DRAFT_381117 [Diplogelasinospora grovesii]
MAGPKQRKGASSSTSSSSSSLKPPFKKAPDSLLPLLSTLSKKHVYVSHIDGKPAPFKRKIFLVPVLMNVVVSLLFLWRMYYILPYYLNLLTSMLGYPNETTLLAADLTYSELSWVILRRTLTFLLDFALVIFVWPWPVEFVVGLKSTHGSPVLWRKAVGFRDREIYIRRSRTSWWDPKSTSTSDVLGDPETRNLLLSYVGLATSPSLLEQKTGYLTMNAEWDLDWSAMVTSHKMVDEKQVALDVFRTLVLVYQKEHGWLCVDLNTGENAKEEERRRQVFAFRDALAAVGKEDLFFRWIEIIQFETSQPGGFTPEKQVQVAQRIRDLFKDEGGIDFDEFWKESVGSDALAGML